MKKNLLLIALTMVMSIGFCKFTVASPKSDVSQPSTTVMNSEGCISGVFVAEEDGHIVGTITLNSNCTFKIVDRADGDITTTTGTYSIDGTVTKGQMAYIEFFVEGRSAGSARIAWPEERGLCILLNGYVFEKQ